MIIHASHEGLAFQTPTGFSIFHFVQKGGKMKKYLGKIIAAIIVLGLVIWGVFYWINNHNTSKDFSSDKKKNSEAQTLIEKDLENYYPSTPSAVVDLWGRINKCWYNQTISEKELDALISQMRLLMDPEFLAINPLEEYRENLVKEIKDYKKNKKLLVLYKVQKQSQVVYFTGKDTDHHDAANYATLVSYLMVQEKKTSVTYTYQKFLLREDEKKHWRIVGWEKTDKIDIE